MQIRYTMEYKSKNVILDFVSRIDIGHIWRKDSW